MLFLFQLHRILRSTNSTELRQFHILPRLPLTILSVQTNSADPVIADGAEHGENCALTSWHNSHTLERF